MLIHDYMCEDGYFKLCAPSIQFIPHPARLRFHSPGEPKRCSEKHRCRAMRLVPVPVFELSLFP